MAQINEPIGSPASSTSTLSVLDISTFGGRTDIVQVRRSVYIVGYQRPIALARMDKTATQSQCLERVGLLGGRYCPI